MPDISKVILDNTQYNIKDTNARDRAENLETSMARLNSNFSDLSDEVSEYASDVEALDTLVQANTNDISTLQSGKVSKSGDTMTGSLTVNSTVTAATGVFGNGNARKIQLNGASDSVGIQSRDENNTVKNAIYMSDSGASCEGGFVLDHSYQIVEKTQAISSVAANTNHSVLFSSVAPSGYTAVALAEASVGNSTIRSWDIGNNNVSIVARSYETIGSGASATIKVLCLRTS